MNKVYEDSEKNLEINTNDTAIECTHQTGVKTGSKPRTIVVQFNSFNNKTGILRNSRKLIGAAISIYEDFYKETLASGKSCRKKFLLIESRERYHTYNIAQLFAKTESKSGKAFYFCYLSQLFMKFIDSYVLPK